jgi:hypothetical protein
VLHDFCYFYDLNVFSGPSNSWYIQFMSRHPYLTFRKPEGINKASAKITREDVKKYIDNVIKEFEELGVSDFISQHPENVVNLDETCFELNALPDKVLTSKEIPHTLKVNAAKNHANVTSTVSIRANGTMLSPQVIFKEPFTSKSLLDVAFAAGG